MQFKACEPGSPEVKVVNNSDNSNLPDTSCQNIIYTNNNHTIFKHIAVKPRDSLLITISIINEKVVPPVETVPYPLELLGDDIDSNEVSIKGHICFMPEAYIPEG